jgi:hypothetical protein
MLAQDPSEELRALVGANKMVDVDCYNGICVRVGWRGKLTPYNVTVRLSASVTCGKRLSALRTLSSLRTYPLQDLVRDCREHDQPA